MGDVSPPDWLRGVIPKRELSATPPLFPVHEDPQIAVFLVIEGLEVSEERRF